MTEWKNRIVASGEVDPKTLEPNLLNWRRHPNEQRVALEGILSEIGWVQTVVVNRNTGRLIDGHLRVLAALQKGENLIPVTWVELTEDEERIALATFDAIARLAMTDDVALGNLLDLVRAEDENLAAFLKTLGTEPMWEDGFEDPMLPDTEGPKEDKPKSSLGSPDTDGEKDLITKPLNFNVNASQRDIIMKAITSYLDGAHVSMSQAEALAEICWRYLDLQD